MGTHIKQYRLKVGLYVQKIMDAMKSEMDATSIFGITIGEGVGFVKARSHKTTKYSTHHILVENILKMHTKLQSA